MPLKVLHVCITPERMKRIETITRGMINIDTWFQLKRARARGQIPVGTAQMETQAEINRREEEIDKVLNFTKNLTPLDIEQGIVVIVLRAGSKLYLTRRDCKYENAD